MRKEIDCERSLCDSVSLIILFGCGYLLWGLYHLANPTHTPPPTGPLYDYGHFWSHSNRMEHTEVSRIPELSEDYMRTMGEMDWRAEERRIAQGKGGPMTRQDLLHLHEALCIEAKNLMVLKNQDYGANDDPFRNFHAFKELGILVRMSDKLARLQTFIERGELSVKEETVRDTIKDLINYAVLLEGYLIANGKVKS